MILLMLSGMRTGAPSVIQPTSASLQFPFFQALTS